MRLRQKPWADKEFSENPRFISHPEKMRGMWADLFEKQTQLHLELGCGKGKFIIENAQKNPNINFLAMEKQERILCMALRSAREADLPKNLYFFCEEAENLDKIFDLGELSRIYINFCDPWRAKGKWRKRRLTHRNFLDIYGRIMKNGQIHLKTDNIGLFRFSVAELEDTGWDIAALTYDLHSSNHTNNIKTEYEEKFSALGTPICKLIAFKEKTPPCQPEEAL